MFLSEIRHVPELAGNRKPESRTFVRSRSTVRQCYERLKNDLFLVSSNSWPVILYGDDTNPFIRAMSDIHPDRSRFVCKPQAVAKDIVECPAQQLTMTRDLERFRLL
jgi:integrase